MKGKEEQWKAMESNEREGQERNNNEKKINQKQ